MDLIGTIAFACFGAAEVGRAESVLFGLRGSLFFPIFSSVVFVYWDSGCFCPDSGC